MKKKVQKCYSGIIFSVSSGIKDITQLQDTYTMEIDFNVRDSMAKLQSLGLIDSQSFTTMSKE